MYNECLISGDLDKGKVFYDSVWRQVDCEMCLVYLVMRMK